MLRCCCGEMVRCCCGEMVRCCCVEMCCCEICTNVNISTSHHINIIFGRKESTLLPKFFSSLTTDDDTLSMPGRA